jgi:N-acetyl-alpha-D-muramate 1-phosphate uridylyltransferase
MGKIGGLILAAGLGSRLKPWTDHHPKALAMVNGKSLLERNVKYLQQFGITELVVNVHHFADQIIAEITKNKGWGSIIQISDETAEVLETGGGLAKAEPLLSGFESILIMNCDILTNLNMQFLIEKHLKSESLATLAVSKRESSRALLFDDKMQMLGWKNINTGEIKPHDLDVPKLENAKSYAFSGIHMVSKKIFERNKLSGKFSMIDLYLSLCSTEKITAYDHTSDLVLDVGKPEALLKAEQLFKN